MATGSLVDLLCERFELLWGLLSAFVSDRGEPDSRSVSPIRAGCFRDSAKALSAEWRLIVSDGESWAESGPEKLVPGASKLFRNASKAPKLLEPGD